MKKHLQEFRADLILAVAKWGYEPEDICEMFGLSIDSLPAALEEQSPNTLFVERSYNRNNLKRVSATSSPQDPIVYFIQQDGGGRLIKIGYTDGPVYNRVSALATASAHELLVLKTVSGSKELEADYHRKFDSYRVSKNREWFYPSQSLLKFIKNL